MHYPPNGAYVKNYSRTVEATASYKAKVAEARLQNLEQA